MDMNAKTKKILMLLMSIIVVGVTSYIIFVGYLVSNGFKDYASFCSKYISQINEYKTKTGHYPSTLEELTKPAFSFRYDIEFCRYYTQTDFYGFTVPEGLIGQALYSSKTRKWTHD